MNAPTVNNNDTQQNPQDPDDSVITEELLQRLRMEDEPLYTWGVIPQWHDNFATPRITMNILALPNDRTNPQDLADSDSDDESFDWNDVDSENPPPLVSRRRIRGDDSDDEAEDDDYDPTPYCFLLVIEDKDASTSSKEDEDASTSTKEDEDASTLTKEDDSTTAAHASKEIPSVVRLD